MIKKLWAPLPAPCCASGMVVCTVDPNAFQRLGFANALQAVGWTGVFCASVGDWVQLMYDVQPEALVLSDYSAA